MSYEIRKRRIKDEDITQLIVQLESEGYTDFQFINSEEVYLTDSKGTYKSRFSKLKKGERPRRDGCLNKTRHFILSSEELFNQKYDYSLVNYIKAKDKVKIICKEHNHIFEQEPTNHLSKKLGCVHCLKKTKISYNGFNENRVSKYIENNGDIDGTIYIIKCFNKNEEFIKIGYTLNDLNTRFTSSNMPYSFEVLEELTIRASKIFQVEQELHQHYKKYKYLPKKSFNGISECFSIQILGEIL